MKRRIAQKRASVPRPRPTKFAATLSATGSLSPST